MLAAPGDFRHLPKGRYRFEVKWDGFRAIIRTGNGFQVRSRRGWDMTDRVPELRALDIDAVLDGELVAFASDGLPGFPLLSSRILHNDRAVDVAFVAFDVLELDGEPTIALPYRERRATLERLGLDDGRLWLTTPVSEDGHVLFNIVRERGLEGMVAKRLDEPYCPVSAETVDRDSCLLGGPFPPPSAPGGSRESPRCPRAGAGRKHRPSGRARPVRACVRDRVGLGVDADARSARPRQRPRDSATAGHVSTPNSSWSYISAHAFDSLA
jgi:hypothetical protein